MYVYTCRHILRSAICLVLVILLGVAQPASAIESRGVGSRPAHPDSKKPRTASIFIYEPRPGTVVHDGVRVINNTDKKRSISVTAVDSLISSDGAFGCAQALDPKKEAGAWIHLSRPTVVLAANTTKVMPFTIQIPKQVEPGEHNACIAVQDTSLKQKAASGIILSFRSALRVAITIPGNAKSNITFDRFDVTVTDTSIVASPSIHNTGNVSADVDLGVNLNDIFGAVTQQHGGRYPILATATGRYNFELPRPFWGGWYTVRATASYTPLGGGTVRQLPMHQQLLFVGPQREALLIELLIVLIVCGISGGGLWYWLYCRRRDLYTVGYTVKPGEDIQEIALRYAIRWKSLAHINRIKPPYNLETGQQIKVPRNKHIK